MAKHEWKVGQITLTVEAPDGVPVHGARVDIHPQDREAFLRSADAVGGLDGLHLPTEEKPYAQSAFTWAKREDGTSDTHVAVSIDEPPREITPKSAVPPHPFFAPLAERAERERIRAQGASTRDEGTTSEQKRAGEPGDGHTEEEMHA